MDPLGESPWADAPAQALPASSTDDSQPAGDDETTQPASDAAPATSAATSTTATTTGNTTASAGSGAGARPSRLTPRRLVAQPTKLQAVEDDPLGPLGAAEAAVSVGSEGEPPMPPQKEPASGPGAMTSPLTLRTTMGGLGLGQGQGLGQGLGLGQQRRSASSDPHQIFDDDVEEERLGSSGGRAPPPVQVATPVEGRMAGPPSVSLEQAAKPMFNISVGDPHKVGDLTSSHIVYSVRTKTTSKAYKQPEFEVKRRYRDFLWLYNTLHANNPGVVVPPPPEKQAVGRFESNFVESRRAALEKMLNKSAAHPTLQHDADLKLFLESESLSVDIKHKERKEPNLGESKGMFSSLGLGGSSSKFVEQDDWFHDRRVYLDALENQLKGLLRAMDTMVGQRKQMAEAAGDFSASLHALSTVELSPSLSGPLEALSDLEMMIRDVYDRQAQQDVLTFGIIIEEYIRLIGSVKQAFGQRQKAFYAWHTAESEMQKRKTNQDKLLRQGKSQQDRLNQVSAEVADAEKKVHQAHLLFEDMGRLLRQELDRFEREKVEDFKSGVETFLESSVEAQKELIEKWETFLLQLDAEDDESVFYRPPVFQSAGGNGNNRSTGNTAVERARARIDEDSD